MSGNLPNQSLKEMFVPALDQPPLCIKYNHDGDNFELKSMQFISCVLDPNKHQKKFHVLCFSRRLNGTIEEQVKLKAFPFSLLEKTKYWLTSLNAMKQIFMQKYIFCF